MRWDRLFEDLDAQFEAEIAAQQSSLAHEAARLVNAKRTIRDRLAPLAGEGAARVSLTLLNDTVNAVRVGVVGADWVGVEHADRRYELIPFSAIVALQRLDPAVAEHSDSASQRALIERMNLGFVLRDLGRRRVPVTVALSTGISVSGTIDSAGVDHLDLAVHDPGAPRRMRDIRGTRMLMYQAISAVRLDNADRV